MDRKKQFKLIKALKGATTNGQAIAAVQECAQGETIGWRTNFAKLEKYFAELENGTPEKTAFNIFVQGNGKLPFWAFSSLPYVSCPGMGACASFCYSLKCWQYPPAFARQCQNFWLLKTRKDEVVKAFAEVKGSFRLYVDGDFDSVETLDFWQTLLKTRDDVLPYGYSKSLLEILAYVKSGKTFAPNYKLNVSSGSRHGAEIVDKVRKLSCVRGDFVAVDTGIKPRAWAMMSAKNKTALVKAQAALDGLGKVFACPGKCGDCLGGKHACGNDKMYGKTIAIGMH